MEAGSMELTNDMIYELAPYARTLGIESEQLTQSLVTVRLPHRTALSTIGGGMHGGALMSLCDLSAAVCGGLNAPEGHFASTAESTTYFLRPLHGSVAIASARPVKVGGSLICIDIDVHNDAGEHCARTTQMLAFRDGR
jgi:1,4-dihydroxy-2-naphthoyl-CoA hydrolase